MKSNRWVYFIPLLVVIALIIMFAKGLFTHSEFAESPLVGKPLPAISLPTLGSDTAFTNDAFKGKYTLLNIFASWCIACKIEHPYLMQLNKQIPIYGIAWKDKELATQALLNQSGNPYTAVGMDTEGKTIIDLGVTGAPETFLIAPDGTVLFRYPGPLNEEVFEKLFAPLIKQEK